VNNEVKQLILKGLVGWCLTALSAHKGYTAPHAKIKKFVKDINFT